MGVWGRYAPKTSPSPFPLTQKPVPPFPRNALSFPAMSKAAPPRHPALAIFVEVIEGVQRDGFIHAGNLAYMAILSLFPFFIVVGAIFSVLGEARERIASVEAFLSAMPPVVSHVLEPVGRAVIGARHGWLMWVGGLVGLWTVSSLIETIRAIACFPR